MDMNFPHPSRTNQAGQQKADYSALVAAATSRQATSRTVSALLAARNERVGEVGTLDSRIAFFARRGKHRPNPAHGAFLPAACGNVQAPVAKFESAVNPADSVNGKFKQLDAVKPELQVAERGTEL
jgi:hypothetical protein